LSAPLKKEFFNRIGQQLPVSVAVEYSGKRPLYRLKSAQAFSAAQRSELSSIVHYVAHGVSQRGRIIAGTQAFLDSDDDVVFLIGHDGEVRQSFSAAHKLLRLATHGKFGRDEASAGSRTKQGPSLAALGGAASPGADRWRGRPAEPHPQHRLGALRIARIFHTRYPQAVEASIAVRIQRQEQTLLKFVDALSDQRLTPKQREVAVGLAKGSSNREIAAAMGVSINTVAYHIKELFLRLDAHDRQQMIAKVLVNGAQSR
jgi:DNA-binding CsgD family transcriptional regulator